MHAGFQPSLHPVEFHWYSAEEGGLLGSQAVAQEYASRGTKVRAMTQLDMTAFVKPGTEPRIGVIQDYVDPAFTKFLTTVAGEYAEIPTVETQCGYACSDREFALQPFLLTFRRRQDAAQAKLSQVGADAAKRRTSILTPPHSHRRLVVQGWGALGLHD